MQLYPAIDLMSGQAVRLRQGRAEEKTVYSDDPVAVAGEWEARGGDWLHVVDLDAATGRGRTSTSALRPAGRSRMARSTAARSAPWSIRAPVPSISAGRSGATHAGRRSRPVPTV